MADDTRNAARLPTMADVAGAAGVSVNTVSLALRRPDRVSAKTLARINASIEAIGYLPNRVAGSLSSQHSNIIATIIPTLVSRLYSDFIDGLTSVFERDSFQMLIGTSRYMLDQEQRLIETFLSYRPAGIVLVGTAHSERSVELLRKIRIPLVESIGLADDFIDCAVGFSNFRAMYTLTEYLLRKGHRNIAYVGSRRHQAQQAQQRLDGYASALEDRGLKAGVIIEREYSVEAGWQSFDEVRSLMPQTDAILYGTSQMASGAILRANALGVKMPDDIAIAAFGDGEIGAFLPPGMTAIAVDFRQIGVRTAEVLLARIKGGGEPIERCVNLGFTLIERGSA